ncbi:MAG: ORF6N domain-containing protein [Candidatus Omnitrophica bacterium]|nr:ORF6N domain-containing protein [Candidatus Omnitrophota bacterium]
MSSKDKRVSTGEGVSIEPLIHYVRGQKVILDADLARIYGVTTKVINQAVKRNRDRFPEDFMFKLTNGEAESLLRSRSQFVTLKRGMNIKYLPYAFTEHGAVMAANVLNSPSAVKMSVFVVRAFMQMRVVLSDHKELLGELRSLEKKLTDRLDVHEVAIVDILQRMMDLLDPPPAPPAQPKPKIGF